MKTHHKDPQNLSQGLNEHEAQQAANVLVFFRVIVSLASGVCPIKEDRHCCKAIRDLSFRLNKKVLGEFLLIISVVVVVVVVVVVDDARVDSDARVKHNSLSSKLQPSGLCLSV